MANWGEELNVGGLRWPVGGEDRVADDLYDLWDDSVPEASKSVHPAGNPMSHSTQFGFNDPRISRAARASCKLYRFSTKYRSAWPERLVESLACGVGQFATAVARPSPDFGDSPARLLFPFTVGVGHIVAVTTSFNGRELRCNVVSDALPERQSLAEGVGQFATTSSRRALASGRPGFPYAIASLALGVGNDPHPVPAVRRTNGGSRYAVPFRVIPDLGKVSENTVKAPSKQSCDVLHDDVAGSYLANETGELAPQSRPGAIDAVAASGGGDVLTGKTSADNINWSVLDGARGLPVRTTLNNSPRPPLSASDARGVGKRPDVVMDRHPRPMFRQHLAAERIDLAERHRLEPARALQPEAETADAAEQIQGPQHHPPPVAAAAPNTRPPPLPDAPARRHLAGACDRATQGKRLVIFVNGPLTTRRASYLGHRTQISAGGIADGCRASFTALPP